MARYCIPCGEERRPELAVCMVDGTPMCRAHEGMGAVGAKRVTLTSTGVPVGVAEGVCWNGCGKARHRGRCAGGSVAAKPIRVAMVKEQAPDRAAEAPLPERPIVPALLPTLAPLPVNVGEVAVLPLSALPVQRRPATESEGHMEQLLTLDDGMMMAVRCRDKNHAVLTIKNVRMRAKARGVLIGASQNGPLIYLWRKSGKDGQ
jgi:hypothetical protein